MIRPTKRLELCFLGAPHVILPDGKQAHFVVANSLMLLTYLAMDVLNPQRRDELAAMIYPDHTEKQASVNLRQTLLRLRRAIGDNTRSQPYLLISQSAMQFNTASSYWLDVAEFEVKIATAQHHRHRRLQACRDCMTQLAQAVALYRGDFLEGVILYHDSRMSDWLEATRNDLRQKVVWALHTLASYYLQRQQFDESTACAAQLLRMDTLDEEALRIEMEALTIKKQRNLAMQRYHEFKARLLATLDVVPEPETIELAQAIRSGQPMESLQGKKQHKDTLLTLQDFSAAALPGILTPFIGHQAELTQITKLLSSQDYRLITLIGPGGVGKTRLAMRAAADDALAWNDGVWLSLLGDTSASYTLEDTLMNALGIKINDSRHRRYQIYDFLRDKEMLLVLDNFESQIERADFVKSLLDHAPRLKIIATSRQRLGIRGEQVILVRGLDFPRQSNGDAIIQNGSESEWMKYGAVQLFVEHARCINPAFSLNAQNIAAIVDICQQVDGLPLGIELAADWTNVFSCQEIMEHLKQNVDILKNFRRDAPPRHVSLRVVFDYSWRLLSPEERQVVKKLSVCKNGVAAEFIIQMSKAGPGLLSSLTDKSMLQEFPTGNLGLHPLLRPYAAEKLAQEPMIEEGDDGSYSHPS